MLVQHDLVINHERDEIINLRFLKVGKLYRASGPNSIFHSPFMDSKKDGLPPAVRPILPPGRTDWTVRNTGVNVVSSE